jgi:hypothetical protein
MQINRFSFKYHCCRALDHLFYIFCGGVVSITTPIRLLFLYPFKCALLEMLSDGTNSSLAYKSHV